MTGSLIRAALFAASAALIAACSNEPAGGRGPFDPSPPPVYAPQPRVVAPPPGQPVTYPPQASAATAAVDPLVRDVQTALGGATEGTAGPAPVTDYGHLENATGIDPNDQSINLALTPYEQQKPQRDADAALRAQAAARLVVDAPQPVPQVDPNANVVRFARSTTHNVGDRVYKRPAFMSRQQSASVCGRFRSQDEAQRQFLANGGPQSDRYNLDPDGDGFACRFSPDAYRQLQF
jgi:hypothetical protein